MPRRPYQMQSGIGTQGAIGVSIRNIDDQNMRSTYTFTAEANGITNK